MLCLGSFTWLEERKGEERASLNYTCSSSSAPIQLGPTRCLPSRFTALVSVAFLYMYFLFLCLFYCLCVFYVWPYLIILEWSQYLLYKDVSSEKKPSTTALHRITAETASKYIFYCSTSLNYAYHMHQPTFLLGLGVSGSYFSGEHGWTPPNYQMCVCSICV